MASDTNLHLAMVLPEEIELLIAIVIFVAPLIGIAWLVRENRGLRQRESSRPGTMARAIPARVRLIVNGFLIVVLGMVPVGMVMTIRQAYTRGRQASAMGRLAQMRLALQIYEDLHGTLPPLCLRDSSGTPIHSWRALILPQLGIEWASQLDLSQPWNSQHNRDLVDSIPLGDWTRFARNNPQTKRPASTHILAYLGRNSIWDARTGLPRGKTTDLPAAILLVSIPKSNLEPMQPGDINEDEVRKLIEQGHVVFFVTAQSGGGFGTIALEDGELVFRGEL